MLGVYSNIQSRMLLQYSQSELYHVNNSSFIQTEARENTSSISAPLSLHTQQHWSCLRYALYTHTQTHAHRHTHTHTHRDTHVTTRVIVGRERSPKATDLQL